MKKGSEDKIGVLDLKRANLLRRLGLKISPAMREYYRYTGISAEVEKRGVGRNRCQQPPPPEGQEDHPHRH